MFNPKTFTTLSRNAKIFLMFKWGISIKELAKEFEITTNQIYVIIRKEKKNG
jgi:Mor family transcriptional regulator